MSEQQLKQQIGTKLQSIKQRLKGIFAFFFPRLTYFVGWYYVMQYLNLPNPWLLHAAFVTLYLVLDYTVFPDGE